MYRQIWRFVYQNLFTYDKALLFILSINQLEMPSKYMNKEGAACMYL